MLEIVQTAAPAPATGAAMSAAASATDADSSGKPGGFQAIMGKMRGEEQKGGGQGDAQTDAIALLHTGENLPTDGTSLPVVMSMPNPMASQISVNQPGLEAESLKAAVTESNALPAQAEGLSNYLRSMLKIDKGAPTFSPTPQMNTAPVLPALDTAVQSKDMSVIAASEVSGKLSNAQALHLQLDSIVAAAPLINADAPLSSQQNTNFAAALVQVGLTAPAPPSNNTTSAVPAVPTPVQQPQWADDVSNRVVWMVKQDIQAADIRLNPPHLGPLEVKISMVQDQVNVSFSTHHTAVREALDSAMPRLREMLTDNGLQLANANVSHRSASDQQGGGSHYYGSGGQALAGEEDGGALSADAGMMTSLSSSLQHYLVDYYA